LSSKVPKRLSPDGHCSDLNDLIKRCAKEKRKPYLASNFD
jgi:hypothetical protein